jgi:large subunit ribosomal protein L1
LVDKTKIYPILEAVELAKKASYSKFVGTISTDLVLKSVESRINVTFPHQTGKKVQVAIVDDALLEEIEAGKINFDVLLTTPAYMPKLAKLARVLGPKGLMPNPKNDTIVADPQKRKAELEGGKIVLKTEKKAPLLHVALGKASMSNEELAANFEALVKACDGKVIKASVSATMGIGVKVALN